MKRPFDLQDFLLRALILVAGVVAAVLLAMKGQAVALPALAAGAVLGVMIMTPTSTTENGDRQR